MYSSSAAAVRCSQWVDNSIFSRLTPVRCPPCKSAGSVYSSGGGATKLCSAPYVAFRIVTLTHVRSLEVSSSYQVGQASGLFSGEKNCLRSACALLLLPRNFSRFRFDCLKLYIRMTVKLLLNLMTCWMHLASIIYANYISLIRVANNDIGYIYIYISCIDLGA